MKKYLFIVTVSAVLIMALGLSSCQKEGVYNPKKKISKIFEQYGSDSKYLSEVWTWDDNKLSRIDYPSWGGYQRFEYENNKISKIIDEDGDYWLVKYNGKKFDKVEFYYDNQLSGIVIFEYSGSKITKMTTEELWDDDKYDLVSVKNRQFGVLKFLIPEMPLEMTKKSTKSTSETYVIKLTWKGNNIEKLEEEEIERNEVYTSTTKYTYDDKSNPFYNSFFGVDDYFVSSKNNITKETITDSDNDFWEYEYSYTYDGNYPKECVRIYRSGTYSSVTTTFYEY